MSESTAIYFTSLYLVPTCSTQKYHIMLGYVRVQFGSDVPFGGLSGNPSVFPFQFCFPSGITLCLVRLRVPIRRKCSIRRSVRQSVCSIYSSILLPYDLCLHIRHISG